MTTEMPATVIPAIFVGVADSGDRGITITAETHVFPDREWLPEIENRSDPKKETEE
jgi:hypothetical protein